MFRQDQIINIPLELLRTLCEIAETGSFTRAAERLGLSQPGISAQMKRLQIMVGGIVFDKSNGVLALSERGKLLLPLAKQMLEMNERILGIGGAIKDRRALRIGVGATYADDIIGVLDRKNSSETSVFCDQSDEIAKGLHDGYFDVGCCLRQNADTSGQYCCWREDLVWVRAKDFLLRHNAPIPLVGWPGSSLDRVGIDALQESGTAYRLMIVASDLRLRMQAVSRGLGVMVMTARGAGDLPENVIIARDYYLPDLKSVEGEIRTRSGLEASRVRPLLETLRVAVAPQ